MFIKKINFQLKKGPIGNTKRKTENNKLKSTIKRSILIIEDNFSVAESLSMVLDLFGYTVYISYDGADGIQKANMIRPTCILCDIGLPDMDGYQVSATLRANKNTQSAYLIALSGYVQAEDIQKALNAGFDLHMAKPPDLNRLRKLLLEI